MDGVRRVQGGVLPLELPQVPQLGEAAAPRSPLEAGAVAAPGTSAPSFGEMLEHGVEQVSELQHAVRDRVEGLMTGDGTEVHDVLLAIGKAEVAFQLMLEIRNRLVDSWREITRLPV